MLNGLVTAFRTLSVLPIPGKEAKNRATSLYSFVLVGFTLGAILYLEAYGLRNFIGSQWPEASGFIMLLTGVFLTRSFHLDGVADFADGFWGGYDRQRTLDIMKDSTSGAFAIVAIVLIMLAKWIALVRLVELSSMIWILSAMVISRAMMVELCVSFPYAREEGTGKTFVEGANQGHRFFALVTSAAIVYLINGLAGVAILCFAIAICRIFGIWCMKKIGGITGDLLGACCEGIEVIVLFFAVAYEILEVIYF